MQCNEIRNGRRGESRLQFSGRIQYTNSGIIKLPERKEKVCVVCSRKDGGPVKRSRTICVIHTYICEKGLHGNCLSEHLKYCKSFF
jgi:hypothetical protein